MKTSLAVLLLCTPMIAHASDAVAPVQPVDKDKKVCRTQEVTGSMFPTRICHSKADWAVIDVQRQGLTDRLHDQKYFGAGDVSK